LKAIAENLGRQATLGKVFVNPYSRSLTLQGFELKDPEETVLYKRAFYAEIHRVLGALQPVGEGEIRSLALDRSARIQALLVQNDQVADTRVFLLDVNNRGKFEDVRVRLDLKLSDYTRYSISR